MRRACWLLLLAVSVAAAQTSFEVAAVKPIDPNAPRKMVGIEYYADGRLVISGFSLHALMDAAYARPYWQVTTPEKWMDQDEFLIEAKVPESAGITNRRHTLFEIDDERTRGMLRSLLAERFKVKVRVDSRPGDVYLVTRSGKPLAMTERAMAAKERDASRGSIGYAGAKWTISATTMADFVQFLSTYVLRAPVEDRTGLTGIYDYRQRDPDVDPDYRDPNPSMLRFIQELGLKLDKTRGIVETLVVEAASKPGEN